MYLPSILQLTELLLFLEELRDIWEWLACECEGLESVECRVLALPLPTPAPPILPVVMVLLWAAVPGVAPPPLLISAVVVVVFWNAAIGLGVTVTMGCTLPAFMPLHTTVPAVGCSVVWCHWIPKWKERYLSHSRGWWWCCYTCCC